MSLNYLQIIEKREKPRKGTWKEKRAQKCDWEYSFTCSQVHFFLLHPHDSFRHLSFISVEHRDPWRSLEALEQSALWPSSLEPSVEMAAWRVKRKLETVLRAWTRSSPIGSSSGQDRPYPALGQGDPIATGSKVHSPEDHDEDESLNFPWARRG